MRTRTLIIFISALCSCAAHHSSTPSPASPDASATPPISGEALVLFGGEDGHSNCLADTWIWQGQTWTQIAATGPSARARSVMAPLGDKLVLFGGWYATNTGADRQYFDDTWTFDGTSWTQLDITGPSPRDDAVMAPLGDKLVLFGGLDESGAPIGETWIFDGAAWTQLDISGPSGREFATMAPLGNVLVLAGGKSGGTLLADTWTFDGTTWTQLDVSGPPPRDSATMTTWGDELVLFGGYNSATTTGAAALFADTWTWNGTAWTALEVTEPVARASAAMATLDSMLVLFGGYGPHYSLSDTWAWNGTTWTQATVTAPPSGRTRPMLAPINL